MMTNFGKKIGSARGNVNGDRESRGLITGQGVYINLFRSTAQSRAAIV
jgi:hypothetical protein